MTRRYKNIKLYGNDVGA